MIPDLEHSHKFSSSNCYYRVIQRLGMGGNSHVYLVEAITGPTRGVLFAMKLFVNLEKQDRLGRFEQEMSFLKRASHPSIMRTFDDGVYPVQSGQTRHDYPFVVAEYLPNTLRDLMRRPIRMVDKLSYALQIISGLAYLQHQAIVHRDIKPENVFVRGSACILGDFGLMKFLSEENSDKGDILFDSTGPRLPRFYRTPDLVEYCRDVTKTPLTCKSDVFQAGLVLAELFTGYNPLKPSKNILDPIEINELPAIPGQHGAIIAAHIKSMLEIDIVRRPVADALFDPWEGVFLGAVGQANALDGKAF